jgi:hypothetical protein
MERWTPLLASRGHAVRLAFAVLIGLVLVLAPGAATASTWRIVNDRWTEDDEKGFSAFVQAIGETNCSSSDDCLRNAANPYRHSDDVFIDMDVACARLPYLLRAYYAWKTGLPFSYIDGVSGEGGDLRFTKTANSAASRHDIIDRGWRIDTPRAIADALSSVFSDTYRTDATEKCGILPDFYSPALQPRSIRATWIMPGRAGKSPLV